MAALGSGGNISRRDPCKKCSLPVFLAERLNVDNDLYHRTCFRCARCSNQLSLANYYETEDGDYCCETCPDEQPITNKSEDKHPNVLTQSLSDDEKEQGLNKDISVHSDNNKIVKTYASEKFTTARSNFVGSQLNINNMEENDDIDGDPPELPATQPPDRDTHGMETNPIHNSSENIDILINPLDKTSSGLGSSESLSIKTSSVDLQSKTSLLNSQEFYVENLINDDSGTSLTTVSNKESENNRNSVRDNFKDIVNINTTNSIKYNSDSINQPLAADIKPLDALDKTNNTEFVTKDNESNTVTNTTQQISLAAVASESLVKLRMKQFEISENDKYIPIVVTAMNSELIRKYVPFEHDEDDDKPSGINTSYTTELFMDTFQSNSNEQLDNSINNIPLTIEYKGIKREKDETLIDKDEKTIKEKQLETKQDDDYPEELNPFEDDDKPKEGDYSISTLPTTTINKIDSTNPFDDDDDEDNDDGDGDEHKNSMKTITTYQNITSPAPKNSVVNPKVNLNPFLSDDEDNSDDATATSLPVPKPRSIHLDQKKTPEPTPRSQKLSMNASSGFHGSSTSLESVKSGKSSVYSPSGTYRKKKLAPPPPSSSEVVNNVDSIKEKTQIAAPPVKIRKNRPAPAPPTLISNDNSTSIQDSELTLSTLNTSLESTISTQISTESIQISAVPSTALEKEKNSKDETNRNRQSVPILAVVPSNNVSTESEVSLHLPPPNKSMFGKWKRKKGPAPPRPVPQRRQIIELLPVEELRRELDIIEIQQQGLEKQGVKLEQLIRNKSEVPGINEDTSLTLEVEDLVLQLFELVNEKNELFRKQAELMYLRRQQRLEEEHADLEYQIRCLMERPESNKTDHDKAREEELIKRLIEVVETRNEIIECLEMDRIREAEEDESINTHLNLYTAKRDEDLHSITSSSQESTKLSKKEKKKQKKIKKNKGITIDVDKDVDETEMNQKEKKKKKWLFHV